MRGAKEEGGASQATDATIFSSDDIDEEYAQDGQDALRELDVRDDKELEDLLAAGRRKTKPKLPACFETYEEQEERDFKAMKATKASSSRSPARSVVSKRGSTFEKHLKKGARQASTFASPQRD